MIIITAIYLKIKYLRALLLLYSMEMERSGVIEGDSIDY